MADFKEIAVRVGADIEPLKKGFKTAGDKVKDFKGTAEKTAKSVALMTTAATAAAGAVVAMANASAESAREIKNLARIAGLGTDEFQRMAYASRTVGIEQDKLSDIYKDVSDKIGDFLQTGAGPMADFFENIAPKIGVTADEFKNLSGPQALQKYVDSLQKANVSQNEMTFYMEAIASDATALIPLLANNGEQMQKLGEEAQKAGVVLSEMDISKLDQMKGSFDKVQGAVKASSQALAAEFAPVLGAIADEFIRARVEGNNFGLSAENVFKFATKTVGVFADGVRGIQVIVKGLEVGFHGFSVVVNTVLGNAAKGIDFFTNSVISAINSMIDGFNKLPGVADIAKIAYSNMGDEILGWADTAKANMEQSVSELHDLMMKPLPSDKIDEFVASAVEAYEKVAEAQMTVLQNSKAEQLATEEDKQRQFWAMHEKYNRSVVDDSQASNDEQIKAQKAFGQQSVSAYSTMFGNLSSLMETENKKQFEIGKMAAKAQTVVDTYASAQSAYKSLAGIPVVGPALGAAAAGAAVVAGVARLNAINSTSFGGGGSISDAGGAAQSAGGGAQSASAAESKTLFVEQIDPASLISGATARSLINEIVEMQRDGYEVVLT